MDLTQQIELTGTNKMFQILWYRLTGDCGIMKQMSLYIIKETESRDLAKI